MKPNRPIDRRALLCGLACGASACLLPRFAGAETVAALHKRPIPSSGEQLPIIGMGSWITFNVGEDVELRNARTKVLQAFFASGGGLIDSSPMYGSSEEVIGYGLNRLGPQQGLFAATKVWTLRGTTGPQQMENSREYWGIKRFDLMQIHNLLSWRSHLPTLLQMKEEDRLRYVGITTSHGRRHGDFAEIMQTQPIDFVQFTYNIADREAERKLLPLAQERGLAVIINRPFQGGRLVDRLQRHPLPEWAAEIDCRSWAQFLLKFVISHPAVTCAIPATSRVDHMIENMEVLRGRLPDARQRKRMVDYVAKL